MIVDKIIETKKVVWENIKDLQPENFKLKYNLEYIKRSLKTHGFSRPFAVCELEGEVYCIDGHTRIGVLKQLQNEGFEIPKELTANFIKVKDRKEAIQTLLEVYNLKGNSINQVAFEDWAEVEQFEIHEFEVASLDVAKELPDGIEDLEPLPSGTEEQEPKFIIQVQLDSLEEQVEVAKELDKIYKIKML